MMMESVFVSKSYKSASSPSMFYYTVITIRVERIDDDDAPGSVQNQLLFGTRIWRGGFEVVSSVELIIAEIFINNI